MSRYWQARKDAGMIKVLPPTTEEIAKYSIKPDQPSDEIKEKADLAANIIRKVYPEYGESMILHIAPVLMQEPMSALKMYLDNMNDVTVANIRKMIAKILEQTPVTPASSKQDVNERVMDGEKGINIMAHGENAQRSNKEYWGSRLHRYGEIPGRYTKTQTHRKERRDGKKATENE